MSKCGTTKHEGGLFVSTRSVDGKFADCKVKNNKQLFHEVKVRNLYVFDLDLVTVRGELRRSFPKVTFFPGNGHPGVSPQVWEINNWGVVAGNQEVSLHEAVILPANTQIVGQETIYTVVKAQWPQIYDQESLELSFQVSTM